MSRVKLTIATTDYDHFPRFSSRYCQGGGHRSYRLTLGHHEIFARFTFNRDSRNKITKFPVVKP